MIPQPSIAQLQQENACLRAELAQVQSRLETLQQENQRLDKSELRYRQIFENAPISMMLINTNGYISQMNAAAENLYGLSIDALNQHGAPIFDNIQLIENGTLSYMRRAFAGEAIVEPPNSYDASRDGEGGKLDYGRGHYAPIRNATGAVEEIVEIAADMNVFFAVQQELLQEKDRAAQERAQLLSAIAQVANLLLRSPDYTAVLPDVVRLLGEAVGSDRCSLIQEVPGSDVIYTPVEWSRPEIGLTLDSTPEMESLMLWSNFASFHEQYARGETANFLVADIEEPSRSILAAQGCTSLLVVPIMVEGQCWGEFGFDNCHEPRLYDQAEIAILRIAADSLAAAIERQAKDDELRKSEALYRSLFEISNEGIYRWQLDQPISPASPVEEQIEQIYQNFTFAQANDACAAMYGLEKGEDVVGMRISQIHVSESEKNRDFVRTFVENGCRVRNAESEEIDASGQKRYFLNSGISFIENGRVTGGWGTQIDITELREAQQALLKAEQDRVTELAKTNQALKNSLDRLAADPDLNGFLGHVVLEIIQQLNLYTAWVELYDPTAQTLQMHLLIEQGTLYLQHDLPDRGYLTEGHPPQDDTAWNLLLQTRQPVIITLDNLSQFFAGDELEMQRQWGQQFGIQSAINLLLMLGDDPLGLLVLFSTERSTFSREELELIEALAQQATLAIALTRLAEEAKHASLLQERNRIAQDIHDTLAQTFGGILIQLQATQYFVKRNPDRAVEQFNIAIELARQGLTEARRSVWTLYDQRAEYEALETALPELAERLTRDRATEAIVQILGTPYRLDPDIGQNLLRLAQEAINNALRHARASAIDILLRYESNHLSLRIRDNGGGFDLTQPIHGFGIGTMRQRAEYLGTTLTIASRLGIGTEIAIVVPTASSELTPSTLSDYLPSEGASKPLQDLS
ncbi:GAF domain-containing protein [Leptolyngbya sp. AN03gr2]|uniref:GAF domain-containing protein n=1 Tax=unclassified Leptolyngbya TaxID=2650499 RepID=UPI003D312084